MRVYLLKNREPVITNAQNRVIDIRSGNLTNNRVALSNGSEHALSDKLYSVRSRVAVWPDKTKVYTVVHSQGISAYELRLIRTSHLTVKDQDEPYTRELEKAYQQLADITREIKRLTCLQKSASKGVGLEGTIRTILSI